MLLRSDAFFDGPLIESPPWWLMVMLCYVMSFIIRSWGSSDHLYFARWYRRHSGSGSGIFGHDFSIAAGRVGARWCWVSEWWKSRPARQPASQGRTVRWRRASFSFTSPLRRRAGWPDGWRRSSWSAWTLDRNVAELNSCTVTIDRRCIRVHGKDEAGSEWEVCLLPAV
jgi:hypothetical protein